MAITYSSMKLKIGDMAPVFRLPSANGFGDVSFNSLKAAKGYLIVFTCCHCPFAKHVADALSKLAYEYNLKGLQTLAISSNDVENYPEDSLKAMQEEAKLRNFQFPFLFDETQDVAKSYYATCTPDFFVFNANRKLYYRGQMDKTRPDSGQKPNAEDLRSALDALISNREKAPFSKQVPSMGCNIKWKKGNEPAYF